MQKLGRIFLALAGFLFIALPILLILAHLGITIRIRRIIEITPIMSLTLFQEMFFTVVPGLAISGYVVTRFDRIKEKLESLKIGEYFWYSILGLGVLFFIWAYSAEGDSILLAADSILPFDFPEALPLRYITPSLQTFTLFLSFFLILNAASFAYTYLIERFDKGDIGALMNALLFSFFFAALFARSGLFGVEELLTSELFPLTRNPGTEIHEASQINYCAAPYDNTGNKVSKFAPNPVGVRDDIEIVGISNVTIEESLGNWPLDWEHYANLSRTMADAKNNILLFDISFVDNKGVYGGNYCGKKFNCTPIGGQAIRDQVKNFRKPLRSRLCEYLKRRRQRRKPTHAAGHARY